MTGDLTFTVVLGAFNEESHVASAIRSVLGQTRADFELVVVDDGSQDRTAEVVLGFTSDPRVRLIQQENRGIAASINAGAAAGSAPYVARIDADDLWMPTYLEGMACALDASPGAGFAFSDAWWLDQSSGRFHRHPVGEHLGAPPEPPSDPISMFRHLLRGNWVNGLTTMRRSVLEELGGYDEELGACEDYDLWLRFLLRGYAGVPTSGAPLAIYRDRANSLTTDGAGMQSNLISMYRGIASNPDLPADMLPLVEQRIAAAERGLATTLDTSTLSRLRAGSRRRLGRLARTVLRSRYWRANPPEAVEAAFPSRDWTTP